jgi:hypothetical protein
MTPGHDAKGRFLPGQQHGVTFTPGHQDMGGGRPPGSPNKPYDSRKELFFERHIESAIADKFCALVVGMMDDLGGQDNLMVGQLQLIRRCAMLSTRCEIMEKEAAEGKPFNDLLYSMLTNTLARALRGLGLEEINARPAQTITVHGLLSDLPVPDNDPSAIKSTLPQGPVEGVASPNRRPGQHSTDRQGVVIGHQQRRGMAT